MPSIPIPAALSAMVLFLAVPLAGCGAGEAEPDVADNGVVTDDNDRLAASVRCALTLEAVSKLPATETRSVITEASASSAQIAAEHASQAAFYRLQAADISAAMGQGYVALHKLYADAGAQIDGARKARTPQDFAIWVGIQADACPAILPGES